MQSEFHVQYQIPASPAPEQGPVRVWQLVNIIMAVFFFLAAYVNLNDDDWFLWVPVYLLPGAISLAIVIKPSLSNNSIVNTVSVVFLTLCAAYGLYQLVLLIAVVKGVQNPIQHEEGREMGGLLIIIAWLSISRFTSIGRPGANVSNKTMMNALLLVTVTLTLLPLIIWSLCLVGDWHTKFGHCKGMFV